jgi:hypothetical protein
MTKEKNFLAIKVKFGIINEVSEGILAVVGSFWVSYLGGISILHRRGVDSASLGQNLAEIFISLCRAACISASVYVEDKWRIFLIRCKV